MTTIVIADDHQLIRDAWANYLGRTPVRIIGQCSNALEAVERCNMLRPDILLLDINMMPFSGIETTRRVKAGSPATGIIAVTLVDDIEVMEKILDAGAMGYVTKDSSTKELTYAILEVTEGRMYISADMQFLRSLVTREPKRFSLIELLTEREKEVLQLIKLGNSSSEISKALNISPHTVDSHRQNIMMKLKVKNTPSLIELVHASEHYR